MIKVAAVLIVSSKGHLLMQHRDDNPNINDPGKITPFGGRLEGGESAIQAAVRELYEETGLKVRTDDLEFLDTYYTTLATGEEAEFHVFVLAGVDEDRVHVYEGQGLQVVRRSDDWEKIDFSEIARKQVMDYFKRRR